MTGFLTLAAKGIVSFSQKLLDYDSSVKALSKSLNVSADEAAKTQAVLAAMGDKTMDEVNASEELLAQFKQLKETAAGIELPDNSQGLAQLKELQSTWQSLKLSVGMGLLWIGYSSEKL